MTRNNNFFYYRQTAIEFVLAISLFIILPDTVIFDKLEQWVFSIFSSIPITFLSILIANVLSMVIIYQFGVKYPAFVSFFTVLNGAALGIIARKFVDTNTLSLLWDLLYPHALFETSAIIIFCGSVKQISISKKNQQNKNMVFGYTMLWFISIPLFMIALFLEVF